MRLGVDGTPLLGQRTGVGRHVAGLLSGLAGCAEVDQISLTAFTWRGGAPLHEFARPGKVRIVHRRAPARGLQASWLRLGWPPVERLAGPVDVFHAPNFVLPPLRRAAGVVTIHDLAFLDHRDTVRGPTLAYRRLVPQSLARAGAVCAPTRVVADQLVQRFGVDPARLVVTPNGLSELWLADPQPADPSWLAARGLPERYLLFVGALEPRKNLPVLLAAHRELPDAPPLVLAGPPGWGDVGTVPADAGRVVRAGYLDEADLVGLVAAARCLVLPSRDEGFGIPPLEALACGVPVVVSDLPVLREVLGSHARYVPVGDAGALAAALAATLAEAPTVDAVARRAHAAQFSWQRCAEAAVRAYRIAVAG